MTTAMTTTEYDYDVVVAGAGPVGLFLACELRLGGARVLVLERRTEVDETIKAGSVNIATAIALYRRGLLPELAAAWEASRARLRAFGGTNGRAPSRTSGRTPGGPSGLPPKVAGHFAGIMLDPDLLDDSDPA